MIWWWLARRGGRCRGQGARYEVRGTTERLQVQGARCEDRFEDRAASFEELVRCEDELVRYEEALVLCGDVRRSEEKLKVDA